jgi:hypothetical protein
MLMVDVYTPKATVFTATLIVDYFGQRAEYSAVVKTKGGEVWHNVQLDINRFKTQEGMTIKSFAKVNAVRFDADDEYLVNNALWV